MGVKRQLCFTIKSQLQNRKRGKEHHHQANITVINVAAKIYWWTLKLEVKVWGQVGFT